MSEVSSNTLPKLTEFRNRHIRILAPYVEARSVMKADLADLKTEFDSAFKETFDRDMRGIQWAGLVKDAKRYFSDKNKAARAECIDTASKQYDLFVE